MFRTLLSTVDFDEGRQQMVATEHRTVRVLRDELLAFAVACGEEFHTAETRRRLLAAAPCRIASAAVAARDAHHGDAARAVLVAALASVPAGAADELWQAVVGAGLSALDRRR